EDSLRVDARLAFHSVNDLADEADVIDLVLLRRAAASACVPGGEDAARQPAVAIWEYGDETRFLGLADQFVLRIVGLEIGVAATAVQCEQHRRRLAVVAFRNVHQIFALHSIVGEAEPIIARSGDRRRVGIGGQLRLKLLLAPDGLAEASEPLGNGSAPDGDSNRREDDNGNDKTRLHERPSSNANSGKILVTALERKLILPLAGRSGILLQLNQDASPPRRALRPG